MKCSEDVYFIVCNTIVVWRPTIYFNSFKNYSNFVSTKKLDYDVIRIKESFKAWNNHAYKRIKMNDCFLWYAKQMKINLIYFFGWSRYIDQIELQQCSLMYFSVLLWLKSQRTTRAHFDKKGSTTRPTLRCDSLTKMELLFPTNKVKSIYFYLSSRWNKTFNG